MSKRIDSSQVDHRILRYEPQTIQLGIPGVAMETLEREKAGADFRVSELVRDQTGLRKLEEENFETLIENRVLARLKEIQENAYREAYDLGLVEGRKSAFEKNDAMLAEQLEELSKLMSSLNTIKSEMLAQNESHLVQLTFHVATRLAGQEISVSPEATLEILRQAVEVAQSEEDIKVRVPEAQLAFFETMQKEKGREFEFMRKLKIEGDPEISAGGCVLTTNYGEIDSRFDERVKKLWEVLKDSLVRVKPELRSA